MRRYGQWSQTPTIPAFRIGNAGVSHGRGTDRILHGLGHRQAPEKLPPKTDAPLRLPRSNAPPAREAIPLPQAACLRAH